MKLTVTEVVSLDGAWQGPGLLEEDTSDDVTQDGWLAPHMGEEFPTAAHRRDLRLFQVYEGVGSPSSQRIWASQC